MPGLRVTTSEHVFDVRFNLADWCTLLRGRFWSHLDTVSDEEMERGISEVREAHGGDDAALVAFPDRFLFIQVFRGHDEPSAAETALGSGILPPRKGRVSQTNSLLTRDK